VPFPVGFVASSSDGFVVSIPVRFVAAFPDGFVVSIPVRFVAPFPDGFVVSFPVGIVASSLDGFVVSFPVGIVVPLSVGVDGESIGGGNSRGIRDPAQAAGGDAGDAVFDFVAIAEFGGAVLE